MIPSFYSEADKKLFEKYQFLPREEYRLGLNLPTDPDPVVDQGIVNTNAFANSGGGSGDGFNVFNPDPNSIVNKEYDPYPYRNAAENSFLPGGSNATDPKYLNQSFDPSGAVADAQQKYNEFQTAPYRMGIDTPVGQRQARYESDLNETIMDNQERYRTQGQYETVDSPLAYSSQTELNKFKDNYPGYYEEEEEPSKIRSLISRGINLIPGIRGLKIAGQALGSFLPTNRRSIMENELAGQGIRVNDTGQIVGDRNTLEGVLAGKNASKVTGKTFDKQIATLEKTLGGKYGLTAKDIADIKSGKKSATDFNLTTDLIGRLRNNIIGKGQFLNIIKKTDTVYGDKKNKDKDKDETNITNPNITANMINEFVTDNDGGDKKNDTPTTTTTPSNPYHGGSGGVHNYGDGDGNGGQQNNGGGQSDSQQGADNAQNEDNQESAGAGGYRRGGRAGYFFGGRAGYAEGGPIYSRLGTLSSGVQSAEQQLQGINASLQKAESDLGSESPGGGSSLAGGPSFTSNFEETNNQGPGSNLLFGGSMDNEGMVNQIASPTITAPTNPYDYSGNLAGDNTLNNTTAPISSIGGISSPPSTGGVKTGGAGQTLTGQELVDQIRSRMQQQDVKTPSFNAYAQEVIKTGGYPTKQFEDYSDLDSNFFSSKPMEQLPSIGGGLGGLLGNNSGNKIMDTRDRSNDNRSYEERVRLAQEANDAPTGIMRNDGTRADLTYRNFSGLPRPFDAIGGSGNKPVDKPFPNFFDINKGIGSIL